MRCCLAGALRGRRAGWPTGTARAPGKQRWASAASRRGRSALSPSACPTRMRPCGGGTSGGLPWPLCVVRRSRSRGAAGGGRPGAVCLGHRWCWPHGVPEPLDHHEGKGGAWSGGVAGAEPPWAPDARDTHHGRAVRRAPRGGPAGAALAAAARLVAYAAASPPAGAPAGVAGRPSLERRQAGGADV